MKQLTLPFAEETHFAAEDFCPAPSNAAAREWLLHPNRWNNGRLVLWGEAGCGKTHLLHIWAQAHQADIISSASLQGLIGSASLQGLRRVQNPIALDDADLAPDPLALLHLLNSAAEAGQPALLAARLPPARMAYKLADLTSRLRAASAVEIRPPEDELLEQLLTRLAAARQLSLSIPVRNTLLLHLPRAPAFYREAVARLDRAALDRSAKINRALALEIVTGLLQND
jgi:chromosomal replication initiation ATPase DnaA